jgi:hypothetical protein
MLAISHANWILDCSENFIDDSERPATWMWAHDELMESHFTRVKKARDEKHGGKKQDETADMMHNQLAERYKR